jgi:hypothetical protein
MRRPVLLKKKPPLAFLQGWIKVTTGWPYWIRKRVYGEPHLTEYMNGGLYDSEPYHVREEDREILGIQ